MMQAHYDSDLVVTLIPLVRGPLQTWVLETVSWAGAWQLSSAVCNVKCHAQADCAKKQYLPAIPAALLVEATQTKVSELDNALLEVDQYICGLQVPMHHALALGVFERLQHLVRVGLDVAQGQGAPALQQILQAAVHVLQHEHDLVLVEQRVVEPAHQTVSAGFDQLLRLSALDLQTWGRPRGQITKEQVRLLLAIGRCYLWCCAASCSPSNYF